MDKGSNQKLQMLSNKCKHICKKYAGEIKGRGTIHTKLEGEIKAPSETLTLQLSIDDDRMKHKVWLHFQGSKSKISDMVASPMF